MIANVRGAALGSGLELALACHWRFADKSAFLGFLETYDGLIPGMKAITYRSNEESALSSSCYTNELPPLIFETGMDAILDVVIIKVISKLTLSKDYLTQSMWCKMIFRMWRNSTPFLYITA